MEPLDKQPGASALNEFFRLGQTKQFQKGQAIIRRSEPPTGIYLIQSGHIKVSSIGDGGEERIHLILSKNDIFPVPWIFLRRLPFADYSAMDDASLSYQPTAACQRFVVDRADVLITIIAELLVTYERVYNLNLESAEQRVIHHLLFLAERFGADAEAGSGFVAIDLKLTQAVFASSVRISRETAGRILNDLEAKQAVILGRKMIRVMPQKLSGLLHD